MLTRVITALRRRPSAGRSIPEGERVYAIGDVHGHDDLLAKLLLKIDEDDAAREPAETLLVFLGDLIDRGPKSAEVVERIRRLTLASPRVRVIMGNHEEMLLQSIAGDERALRMFCRAGGRETLLSYGLSPQDYDTLTYTALLDALPTLLPPEHIAFMSGFEDVIERGDYAFVHAGIDPAKPLADQDTADLRWIRGRFLKHGQPLERMIVHGHSISAEVEFERHRIGVDTGAYRTGRLSALCLDGSGQSVVQVEGDVGAVAGGQQNPHDVPRALAKA